jgi:hypothetical protein
MVVHTGHESYNLQVALAIPLSSFCLLLVIFQIRVLLVVHGILYQGMSVRTERRTTVP